MFLVRDIIEKVWESCFLTPEYKSGDEPERRIILADKRASEGKDSQWAETEVDMRSVLRLTMGSVRFYLPFN